MAKFSFFALLLFVSFVQAAPTDVEASKFKSLSTKEIAAFKPFTYYALAAGCGNAKTLGWTCGAACKANSGFKPIASGGDGAKTQFWFVGYDPTLKTVIVSHQGTDTRESEALLINLKTTPKALDPKLFPKLPPGILVHEGFAETHSRSAEPILAAVKKAIGQYAAKQVTIVGHSLGAAISLLDGIFLPPWFPEVSFKVIGYGMPRVGNQVFANFVDKQKLSLTRINNGNDLVPIIPGRSGGYSHPSGEIHIQKPNSWLVCPGQDNKDSQCSTGAVPSIFEGSVDDHMGPYDGITFRHC